MACAYTLIQEGTPMIYRDSLSPWCVVQQLPKLQHAIVARFRNRNDAEEYIKVIRRINPTGTYEIMFDPPIAPTQKIP